MSLKILSWNCQSAQGKILELKRFISTNNFHVIFLQETWLNPKISSNVIKIPNYACERVDRQSDSRYPHGGVLAFIHCSIKYRKINFANLFHTESLFIEVTVDNKVYTIGTVYSSSSLSISESRSDFVTLLSRPGPFIITGDWNARHSEWNNVKTNRKGTNLSKIAHDNLCDIHFPDQPTTYPSIGFPSTLDLVISKNAVGISKPVIRNNNMDHFTSDHVPISFEILANIEIPIVSKVRSFKKADWKKFQSVFSEEMLLLTESSNCLLSTTTDIDQSIEQFKKIVRNAVDKSIPLVLPFKFRYPFSHKLLNLTRQRNAIRKKVGSNRRLKTILNELNREIRLEIATLNRISWEEKVRSLSTEDLSLYQLAKCLKKKKKPIPPLKTSVGNFAFSDKEKADLLANNFLRSHQISQATTIHTNAVQDSVGAISRETFVLERWEKISVRELTAAIKQLKVKTSPGHDDISNAIIKRIPAIGVKFLTDIYEACLKLSYFPRDWKIGKVVAIPKAGKDLLSPSSYRPITLLPNIGKIFEKLVLGRLQDHEKNNKIIKDQQFGFREKHSTTQQIMRIVETATLRFNENKSTALITLDVEKAFDSVWHDALLHKLNQHKFPAYLVKLISSFLTDRISFVIVNGINSHRYEVKAGVPQGSPLSPYLFNIFINDMPVPAHCKIAKYADDTGLLTSIHNYDLPTLITRAEKGLEEINSYFSKWKSKLNEGKTEAVLLTKSPKMIKLCDSQKIEFDSHVLEWKDNVKYLGMLLDRKLTFKDNIQYNISKAGKAIAMLYPLLKKHSGVSVHAKSTLYRSYIRPIMTYACPVFVNCAKTHLNKLQILQNKCLRMVLSAPYWTRIDDMHNRLNIPTINNYVGKLTRTFYETAERSDNKLVARLGDYSTRTTTRVKHRLPRPS